MHTTIEHSRWVAAATVASDWTWRVRDQRNAILTVLWIQDETDRVASHRIAAMGWDGSMGFWLCSWSKVRKSNNAKGSMMVAELYSTVRYRAASRNKKGGPGVVLCQTVHHVGCAPPGVAPTLYFPG